MDKAEYQRQLEGALRRWFAAAEIQEILADYEGFFAAGAAEGKPEAQVIEELGAPKTVARELSAELKKPVLRIGTANWRFYLSVLVLAVFGAFSALYQGSDDRLPFWVTVVTLVILASLLFGLTPSAQGRPVATAHGRLLLTAGALYGWLHYLVWLIRVYDETTETSARLFVFSVQALQILTLLLALRALRMYFFAASGSLTVIFHTVTVTAFLSGIMVYLSNMSDVGVFWDGIHTLVLRYALQTAVVLLAFWAAQQIRRRGAWKRK